MKPSSAGLTGTMMTDSRATGEPIEYGPKAQSIITGFRITLTEPMEPLGKVKFEVDKWTLKKRYEWDYCRIICPRCGREFEDEQQHCWMWLEDHIHMSHGYELPRDHPLHRRTRAMKLMDWVMQDDAVDL